MMAYTISTNFEDKIRQYKPKTYGYDWIGYGNGNNDLS